MGTGDCDANGLEPSDAVRSAIRFQSGNRVGRSGAGVLLPWQKLRGQTWGQDGAISILPALQSHLGRFQSSGTPVSIEILAE